MDSNTYEIERKFLIKYPNTELLKKEYGATESVIEQIYLEKNEEGANRRIRKRTYENSSEYTATSKKRISDIKRIENERVISREEYEALKKEADKKLTPIKKRRIIFNYKNHMLEIDIFDFWSAAAFLEIELKSEEEQFEIPSCIEIVAELTSDRRFTNHSIAKNIPDITIYMKK